MADDYENWYEWYRGIPSTFEPEFGELYTGYKLEPGRMGDTTNPSLADQVTAISEKLRQGMKNIEIGAISADLFESIPKQHFEKMRDLAKLTGAEVSIHSPFSPTIDLVGLDDKGGWSESNRQEAERRLMNVIEKSHDINPKGNIPITVHATMAPTEEWANEKEKESIGVINPETGEFGMIKGRIHASPRDLAEGREMQKSTPEHELEVINQTTWIDHVNRLEAHERAIKERLRDASRDKEGINMKEVNNARKKISERYIELRNRGIEKEKAAERSIQEANLTETESFENNKYVQFVEGRISDANSIMINELMPAMNSVMTKAYSDEEVRGDLIKISEVYNDMMKKGNEIAGKGDSINAAIMYNKAQETIIKGLESINPKSYIPIKEFAKEKASDTISSLAWKSFDEFKDTSPIIAIENIYPGVAFSSADELKGLIEESRKKFVDRAVGQGIARGEAENQAKKLIGATWDIGHINMTKKHGIKEEQILAETKKISPYIKKVHVTDNFGFGDTHLAPGMGNVEVKEHMKAIERAGFKGKVIAEMGGLHQHFKVPSAYPYALESMGSSLYSPAVASYWGRAPSRSSMIPESDYSWAPVTRELGGKTQKPQYSTQ